MLPVLCVKYVLRGTPASQPAQYVRDLLDDDVICFMRTISFGSVFCIPCSSQSTSWLAGEPHRLMAERTGCSGSLGPVARRTTSEEQLSRRNS